MLDSRFRSRFDADVPEVLNDSHQILIVGATIDPATERIVTYLSNTHGVEINAVEFHYLTNTDSTAGEYLARTFLLEPELVEYKARTRKTSKRRPALTFEELEGKANEAGVGMLYKDLLDQLTHLRWGTSRSSARLFGDVDGNWRVVFSVLPGESSATTGLRFQVYFQRFCRLFNISDDDALAVLPATREPWSYGSSDPEW